MCGICGFLNLRRDRPVAPEVLEAMTARLSHRGPDGAGTHIDRFVGLGHRRLSVIDVAGGCQPLANEDGTIWVTYNGEIYNFKEIRENLKRKGHVFSTECDTEVIVHAYEDDGPDCVSRFNGIFAFALWDRSRTLLLLARDRLGVKPLYYTVRDDTLIFASEIKAILAHPAVRAEVDPEAVSDSLLCTALLGDKTMFKGIQALPPGTLRIVQPHGVEQQAYWSLDQAGQRHNGASLETCRDRVGELLASAVGLQVISDVPFGTLLSGGLDSSLISALARRHVGGRLRTFAMGYDHSTTLRAEDVDAPFAGLVADALDTDHTAFLFQPGDYETVLERTTWHVEKPVDLTAPSLYLLYRDVKPNVTVVMSGEGADELFAGYYFFLDRCRTGPVSEFPWAPFLTQVSGLLDPTVARDTRCHERIRDTLADETRRFGGDCRLNTLLYLFLRYYLVDMLERLDKTSMAWGVESRVPFLDHRLVEYTLNMPSAYKTQAGTEKVLLRSLATSLLPAPVVTRKKRPIPIPVDPKSLFTARNRANALVQAPQSRIAGYFNRRKVDDFFHLRGPYTGTDPLAILRTAHALIALDAWHAAYGVAS